MHREFKNTSLRTICEYYLLLYFIIIFEHKIYIIFIYSHKLYCIVFIFLLNLTFRMVVRISFEIILSIILNRFLLFSTKEYRNLISVFETRKYIYSFTVPYFHLSAINIITLTSPFFSEYPPTCPILH